MALAFPPSGPLLWSDRLSEQRFPRHTESKGGITRRMPAEGGRAYIAGRWCAGRGYSFTTRTPAHRAFETTCTVYSPIGSARKSTTQSAREAVSWRTTAPRALMTETWPPTNSWGKLSVTVPAVGLGKALSEV